MVAGQYASCADILLAGKKFADLYSLDSSFQVKLGGVGSIIDFEVLGFLVCRLAWQNITHVGDGVCWRLTSEAVRIDYGCQY